MAFLSEIIFQTGFTLSKSKSLPAFLAVLVENRKFGSQEYFQISHMNAAQQPWQSSNQDMKSNSHSLLNGNNNVTKKFKETCKCLEKEDEHKLPFTVDGFVARAISKKKPANLFIPTTFYLPWLNKRKQQQQIKLKVS